MKSIIKYSILIFTVFILYTVAGCKKEGMGGNSSVNGYLKHHNKLIPNSDVYIKYGATEFPGNDITKYDKHVMGDANAHYEFIELEKGDYYLWGVGYDNSIMDTVRGGVAVKLKRNKATTLDIPVTEIH